MKTTAALGLALGFLIVARPERTTAQAAGNLLTQAVHDCTFARPCNWTSHALIAFGTTYLLHRLRVPAPAAAGAAALLYVGKEVRDHLKWGVLGSADSNGDLLSGCAGALIAFYAVNPSFRESVAAITLEVRERTWLTVKLYAP